MKKLVISLCVLGLFALAGVATAAPCSVSIDYPDVGPTPKYTSAHVNPSLSLGLNAQIDDGRSYSIVSVSGPNNSDLGESIFSFNGRVSYNADTVGTYTVTVQVLWYCENGVVGSDTDTFTVSIC